MKQDETLWCEIIEFGIPKVDAIIIEDTLKRTGQLPEYVVENIQRKRVEIDRVHPDQFPWPAWRYDQMVNSLEKARIGESQDARGKITNDLEEYALGRYHDTKKLSSLTSNQLAARGF
jgi:hypothetical protein